MTSDVSPVQRTGGQLWAAFVAMAGLDPLVPYDRQLQDAVGRKLEVGWGSSLADELDRRGIDATTVLIAVLEELEPWSLMMRDLLELFSAFGVKRTRTQLRAAVDIDRAGKELELELKDFADGADSVRRVRRTLGRVWSNDDRSLLWHIARGARPGYGEPAAPPLPPDVQAWLDAYQGDDEHPGTWRAPLDRLPPTGHPALDASLEVARQGWASVIHRYHELAQTRAELYDRLRDDIPLEETDTWLASADTDLFASSTLEGLCHLARRAANDEWPLDADGTFAPDTPPANLITLTTGLDVDVVSDVLEDILEPILSLPVWKFRYDMYSNWVFTRIVKVLQSYAPLVIKDKKGCLAFGFASSLLAECPELDLSVYCELRSDLLEPSKKRSESVQPDYTIIIGDTTNVVDTSVLEVECKQYVKADVANFTEALRDYSASRPAARVVIVDYGTVSARTRDTILNGIREDRRERCDVIGELRPRSDEAESSFRAFAARTLSSHLPAPALAPIDVSKPLRIELTWTATERDTDLDLWLAIEDAGDGTPITYNNSNRPGTDPPYASLEADIYDAPGPEVLHIHRWLPSTYRLAVNRYGGGDLTACGAAIRLESGETTVLTILCPPAAVDRWDVLEIDGRTGTVTIGEHQGAT